MGGEWIAAIGTLAGTVVGGLISAAVQRIAGNQARHARRVERQERLLRELSETAVQVKHLIWLANQNRVHPAGLPTSCIPHEDRDRLVPVIRRCGMLGQLPGDQVVREKALRVVELATTAWTTPQGYHAAEEAVVRAINELMDSIGEAFRDLG